MTDGRKLEKLKASLVERFFKLINSYLEELEVTPIRGSYNKMFGTWSKSQNDLKKEYKGRLETVMSMMDHFGVNTKSYAPMVPVPEKEEHGMLGPIKEGE